MSEMIVAFLLAAIGAALLLVELRWPSERQIGTVAGTLLLVDGIILFVYAQAMPTTMVTETIVIFTVVVLGIIGLVLTVVRLSGGGVKYQPVDRIAE